MTVEVQLLQYAAISFASFSSMTLVGFSFSSSLILVSALQSNLTDVSFVEHFDHKCSIGFDADQPEAFVVTVN